MPPPPPRPSRRPALLACAAVAAVGCQGAQPSPGGDLGALLVGALLVALPLSLGVAVGAALRRLLAGRGALRVVASLVVAAGALAASAALAARTPSIGAWDVLGTAALFALAVAVTSAWPAARVDRRGVAVALISTLLCLALAEVVARVALPPAPRFPPAREARLTLPAMSRDEACTSMFPEQSGVIRERARDVLGRASLVLHVGDSMTAGTGTTREQAFPAALSAMQPDVGHVNAGVAGVSLDKELLVARAWTERLPARLVVLHVFTANDIQEVNLASPCCDMMPVLEEVGGAVRPRCPTARWRVPFAWNLSSSPAPYALRVVAGRSALAAHLTAAFSRVARSSVPGARLDAIAPPPYEARWRTFALALARLRDDLRARHVGLLVSVIPSRYTMERALGRPIVGVDMWGSLDEGQRARLRMLSIAREAGVDVIDPWDTLLDAVRTVDPDALFTHDCPGDFHLSPVGHQIYARWLAPQIAARLRAEAPR